MIFSWRTVSGLPPVKAAGYTEFDPSTLRLVRGPDAVTLRLGWRLAFFRGEWFLDQRLGVPYYQQIMRPNPNRALISQIFRDVIASTPGVSEVVSLSVGVDKANRQALVTFEARLDDGDTIVKAQDAPLLIRRTGG